MRRAFYDGQFYEAGFQELDEQIKKCFTSKFGPGDLPVNKRNKNIIGIVSPHAGYQFSGSCAAWVYKEISESKFPDVFVIIGVDHGGFGRKFSINIEDDWETPFGIVKVARSFGEFLMKRFPELKQDKGVHAKEHSIEVQLPFLQFVNKDKLSGVKILPILVSNYDYESCRDLGKAIANAGKEDGKKICIIASSDFTHYGPNYGYMPFMFNKKEGLYKLDKDAIEFIEKLDAKGFLAYKSKTKATICGAGAITVVIETCKNLDAKKGKLLCYYTSGDVVRNYENAVGYAGVVFE